MLGLLLIYFIGKKYFNLAEEHDKNRWVFAVAGVIAYYVGTFIGAALIGIFAELISPGWLDEINEWLFGIMALPFGIFSTWGLYIWLERRWSVREKGSLEAIEQIGQE